MKTNGSPHLSALIFAYVDGMLYTSIHPDSLCYRNLRKDNRVSAAFTEKGGKGRTVILEGRANEAGRISHLLKTAVARIESEIGEWLAHSSATYSSRSDDRSSLFEIKIEKIFTYLA